MKISKEKRKQKRKIKGIKNNDYSDIKKVIFKKTFLLRNSFRFSDPDGLQAKYGVRKACCMWSVCVNILNCEARKNLYVKSTFLTYFILVCQIFDLHARAIYYKTQIKNLAISVRVV